MGENSAIEWTDHIDRNATGRLLGAYKSAATKAGCSLQEWFDQRATGRKWCFRCRQWHPADTFSIDASRGDGRTSSCKNCTSKASTASRYRLTHAALREIGAGQIGICPICNRSKMLVVDHDHSTGEIRDALCSRCNVGLGQFKDDTDLLRAAILYLERHHG